MPLTEQATFKTRLQRHSRLTVPKLLRWRYKIEPTQLLTVRVKPLSPQNFGEEEEFLAKMAADGRLTVPKLVMEILAEKEEKDLFGCILEVTISPAGEIGGAASAVDAESP
jgi:bifunctional DNA-binding transcriptional regulator/antitoxin component of YhaV-PrlF toxin-antitoxin module